MTSNLTRSSALVFAMLMTGSAASSAQTYIALDRRAEPLKGRFNSEVNKTRVLMLVAPT